MNKKITPLPSFQPASCNPNNYEGSTAQFLSIIERLASDALTVNEKLKLSKIANAEVVMELWESFLKLNQHLCKVDQSIMNHDRSVMLRVIRSMKA